MLVLLSLVFLTIGVSAIKHVGTKVSTDDIVRYGEAFFFWNKQLNEPFESAVGGCLWVCACHCLYTLNVLWCGGLLY
jgi:hypothetical protein